MAEATDTELEQIKERLTKLSQKQRGKLASFLLESLGPPPGVWCEDDPGFEEELARRIEDFRSGKEQGVPAEEVLRELREKYG